MKDKSSILEYIIEALPDRRVRFVFPSAVPAHFWARAAAEASLEPITPTRFMAWDTFKAQTLAVKQPEKEAINRAMRTLFASSLLRENAQKGKQFLSDYINPVYAASYSSFISSLAKLLPSLEGILMRSQAAGTEEDPYFVDLQQIRERYGVFLDEHRLYEPAWNRAAFTPSQDRWLLFFPELVEDWEEYREELLSLAEPDPGSPLRILPLELIAPPKPRNSSEILKVMLGEYGGKHIQFSSAGEEYRWLALTIRRLLDEGGLSLEDIAISFPGEADPERLLREFRLQGIPPNPRHGRSLTEYPGGRIFQTLSACPATKWSFQSLKNLLLDKAFPWKDTRYINALMDFGLKYRCVSGFTNGRYEIDVWEQTFEDHKKQDFAELPVFKIAAFYQRLKQAILGLVNAPSFAELAQNWRQFETRYFDPPAINTEVNKIIARIIKALDELVEIEERFPVLSRGPDEGKVFPVFQSYIQEETYVYQPDHPGIPIYDYKVAAGIGPLVHFIINMSQEAAAAVYTGGASFLREDRKKALGIQDRDISGEFIAAYRFSGSFPLFTLSLKTFNGPAIPHRRLSEILGNPLSGDALWFPEDPYRTEAALADGKGTQASPVYPSEIQKRGWQALRILRKPPLGEDMRTNPVTDAGLRAVLQERLGKQALFRKKPGLPPLGEEETLRIAPTDLNEYLACPFQWVLQRGLHIREKQTEIETIDQRELGNLYHRILERLFRRIKQEEGRFRGEDLLRYQGYLKEETRTALAEARSGEGAFQKSIYAMLENRIFAALSDYLTEDLETLNGAEILGAEYALRKTYSPEEPLLSGITDLVLEYEAGGLILTDFKTGTIPKKKDLFAGERDIPEDLQMAAYIAMIEDAEDGKQVKTARFYGIDKRKFQRVISEEEEDEKKRIERRAYEKEVASVDTVFALVTEAMKQGAYRAPEKPERKQCAQCKVSSVCRIPFTGGEPKEPQSEGKGI